MSILIRGMEMPKSCYACMFFAQTDHWNKEDEADILSHCKRTGEKTWESVNGYLPNCPLVPIQPHGRCIDESALLKGCGYIIADGMACIPVKYIANAPTIIPAEEGE